MQRVGNFQIHPFMDSETKQLDCRVLFKGKKVNKEVLEDRISKRYLGLHLIRDDLNQVATWLSYLDSGMNKEIERSLFVSSLTFYWKCFAKAEGRGRLLRQRVEVV